MRYRRTVFLRDNQNPWAPLLAALRERANPLPPSRGRSLWQLYMSKKPDEIAAVFDERWPDAGLNASDALALRSKIARELLNKETEEYRAELKAELAAEHAAEDEDEDEEEHAPVSQDDREV